jgi:glycosyltransferase involved in cell wall biosynthesis
MAQKQIRILHTLGSLDPGGVETWLLNILKYIDREHFQFDFCTFGSRAGLNAKEVERLGGKILRCPKGPNLLSFRRRFRKILREGNYDVVHSHVHLFSGALLRWAKAEGVPVRIAHSHTSRDDRPNTPPRASYRRLMKSWIDRYATHGLAASRLAAAQLFGPEWESDTRFRVLYYGIELTPFQEPISREDVRGELGIPLDAPVVGHVGRFVQAKNHDFLMEIAGEILSRRPEIHFLLVGDGPLRPNIEAKARAMGLSGNMHFVGNRRDVPRLMRGAMDVFVLPSLWEGLPVTLIEAQAAGLRCIFSDVITGEANILTGQCVRLSLSGGVGEWVARIMQALRWKRPNVDLTVEAIAQTDFCVQRSTSFLSDLCLAAVG